MPLKGIKVLELCGLAPGPFCGKVLTDFGASVTVVDKVLHNPLDVLNHGKRFLPLNLKNPNGQQLIRKLCKSYDVVIEPFRPGVMEKLNLGPEILCKDNPKLIYARLTGFGQNGRLANRAGHDINYVALSGVLSLLGRAKEKPTPPINILADFAGGGLLCAMGICLALLERHRSGKGQVIDSAMVEGAAYVSSWITMSQKTPIWSGDGRGTNFLDSGAFYYDTYETKDGKFMSVGALEEKFFRNFVDKLGLPHLEQSISNEEGKELVTKAFLTKTQKEWAEIFEDCDACVYPVVDWKNVMQHDHNQSRKSFIQTDEGDVIPNPAPRLSRTPGRIKFEKDTNAFDAACDILAEIGQSTNDVKKLIENEVLLIPLNAKL
ncbi:alpha-methylacyl-CoA racemase [Episyrphus balteatus]|uniref:alpha-methylacyl-CoA racemase n=1 Tax=Episyrphus balteatus TaxID=286459 RepID=UPI002484E7EB|nr:alpha-methylacyl-CoA racemase [Episyrphus balteatus]